MYGYTVFLWIQGYGQRQVDAVRHRCRVPRVYEGDGRGMKRADILHTAEKCVCGQREQDYGSPENNFQTIADFWSVYKGVKFSASDVAMMMALLKVARIKSGGGTEDSFVDLAGYAACGGELVTEVPTKCAQNGLHFRVW